MGHETAEKSLESKYGVCVAADLARKMLNEHSRAHALHVQLDDMNLEDAFFDDDHRKGLSEDETRCFDAFRALTEDERYSAIAMADG